MAKKRGRKSLLNSRFYQIYFIVVAIALVGIFVGMFYLHGMLAEYESAQPDYVAEPVAQLFERGDFDALYAYDDTAASIADGDPAFYTERMRALTAGRSVTWRESVSMSDDEKLYKVLLDGEKFAEITLRKTGETTRHGTPLWQLAKVHTLVELATPAPTPEPTPVPATPVPTAEPAPAAAYACSVTVPEGWQVVLGNQPLTEDNASVTRTPSAAASLIPDNVPDRALVQYQFSSPTDHPALLIVDSNGEWITPPDSDTLTWSYGWPEDTQLSELYGEDVLGMAKRFIQYSTKRLSQDSLLRSCAKGSPARDKIKNFDMSYGLTPKSDSYEDVVMSNFCRYSDGCFTCTISMNYVAHFGNTDKTFPVNYAFCFVSEGGEGKLYDFALNG